MRKIKLTGFTCMVMLALSAFHCEKDMPEPPVINTGGGSSGSYNCSAGYSGPKNDPQSDSFCQAAYAYRCSGEDAKADANCKIYKQMQEDNPGMVDCPYCP